ncbi:MAG TPA: DUF2461 domain-containing protein [Chloroflexota bacterium]|jgi:uncharacterized protein (TIGR02453 family)|nr:DUF2461 domain-containing protein [Chloroflexota bacterium]
MATVTGRSTERFTGFPEGGVEFFLELQAEQSRTWFKAHQAEFDRLWKRPLELFVDDLRTRLLDAYPHLLESPPHFMRIQRDIRFSRDKSPYKTWVAASVPIRPVVGETDDMHGAPGMYVSFGLESEYVGVGSWHMSPEVLQRYRQAVAADKTGRPLQASINNLVKDGFSIEAMERTKRVPPPYPQDHPRGELLKHKGLAVGIQVPEGLSQSPELLDWAEARLRSSKPVVDWLDRNLA